MSSFYVLQNFIFTRDGADCEESDLLRATLGSSPLESIYFSIKNSRTNNLMNYSPLSAHLRSINTHVSYIIQFVKVLIYHPPIYYLLNPHHLKFGGGDIQMFNFKKKLR